MSIAIIAPNRDVQIWKEGMLKIDPSVKIQVWPELTDPEAIECAAVWNHPPGILNQLPNLKLICSMGAGVDHVLTDAGIPPHIPITRIIEEKLSAAMTNFVLMAVLNFHKRFYAYQEDKRNKRWDQATYPEVEVSVGILGLGVLGQDAARQLVALGFEVHGLSRTRKHVHGVQLYTSAEMDTFLKSINVLVCLLPYTPENHGLLNYDFFQKMNRGSYLINVARGKHHVEADIIRSIEEGQLSGAFLDVFETEPLPKDSPIWTHPKIQYTPHIASITNPQAAIPQIMENFHRVKIGEAPLKMIDRNKGY